MQKKSLVWVSVVLCLLYVSQAAILPVLAAEPAVVGGDAGEKIAAPPAEKESGLLPWVLGALAAGLGGWILADQTADTDDADDAEKSAAAAAAASTAAATDAAAVPAAGTTASTDYYVFISGTFTAGTTADNGSGPFTPSVVFSVSDLETNPGGIANYEKSDTSGLAGTGGKYEQVSGNTVMILVDDGYYVGQLTVLSESKLKLSSGMILTAETGAKAYLLKK